MMSCQSPLLGGDSQFEASKETRLLLLLLLLRPREESQEVVVKSKRLEVREDTALVEWLILVFMFLAPLLAFLLLASFLYR